MARPKSGSPRASTATISFEAKLWLTADTATRISEDGECAATWRDLRGAQDDRGNNMGAAEYSQSERDRLSNPARRAGAEAPVIHGPACGSGGMFVQSEKSVGSHGQNSNGMQLSLAA